MTNINDPWPDDEVTRRLNDLPEVDPPSTMVQDVMATIASRRTAPATHSVTPTKRGEIMAKKVLWILAATAALALISMRLVGYPPVEKGTEATIGAAQRYQSPQISSADVKTGDAQLQSFLQSDAFHKLTTDKAARQALKNKDFQRALAEPAVRAALATPSVQEAIAAVGAAGGVSHEALSVRLDALGIKSAALLAALEASPALVAALEATPALVAALEASPALAAALVSPDVLAAFQANNALGAVLAQPSMAMFLAQDAVMSAVLSAPDAALDAVAAKD